MKAFSIPALRRMTLASLGVVVVSVPLAKQLREIAGERASAVAQIQANLARSRTDATAIEAELRRATAPRAAPQPLEAVYARLLQYLRAQSAARLVTLQSLEVGNRQIEAKGLPLSQLSEPIAVAGNLRRIRILVKCRYDSLIELQHYLDGIQPYQTVLRSLEIVKDNVAAELLVLGV